MDDQIRKRVREIGSVMRPEMFAETIALFAPLALRPSPDICTVERNISYGPDPRHRLDVFQPATKGGARAIVVYVHGGGFIGGDKGAESAPFYNNVGAWAARSGFIGVTMTYRLAPAFPWPAGAEDLAAVVAWLRANATQHGGDPGRIFLVGQSAGAAHVASYVAMTCFHGDRPTIAGAIMLSGIYDVVRLEHGPFENAYYGTDPSRFPDQSSLPGLIATETPCLFTVAEYDPPLFQRQAALLAEEWFRARRALPRMLFLPDGNHMTAALSLGSSEDSLGGELAAFIRKSGGDNA
ncbi:MAG: alpha/beta hydrolase [Hyphomonadaceae bacterium]|nr:alpha/beta hydrolase [Hyphomonadaceae bacterium]